MIGGLCAYAGVGGVPVFIAIKLVIVAITIGLGLWIRKALAPFGPAFMDMVTSGPTSQTDAGANSTPSTSNAETNTPIATQNAKTILPKKLFITLLHEQNPEHQHSPETDRDDPKKVQLAGAKGH